MKRMKWEGCSQGHPKKSPHNKRPKAEMVPNLEVEVRVLTEGAETTQEVLAVLKEASICLHRDRLRRAGASGLARSCARTHTQTHACMQLCVCVCVCVCVYANTYLVHIFRQASRRTSVHTCIFKLKSHNTYSFSLTHTQHNTQEADDRGRVRVA